MALPAGITPKVVTVGIASFFDGTLAEGTATITAPVNVVHGPTNRPIFSSTMSQRFVDGVATFTLAPTDAAGLNRVDWTYKLNVVISGALVQPDPIYFILPAAGPDTIDLDGLVTVPSSAGVPISVDAITYPAGGTDGQALIKSGTSVAWGAAGGGSTLAVASTVTAAGALVTGKHNPVDATAGAKAMTLPTGATGGTLLAVEKTDASANAVTVTGNVRGTAATTISLAWQNEALLLAADASGSWWPVAGHKTKTSLDAAYAARGNNVHDMNAAPYNLKPGDDATTALQTAINAIVASGASGKIRFSQIGTYTINGAQQTGTFTGTGVDPYTWSGQVVFPATPFASATGQAITIEGPMTTSTGTLNTGTPSGLILQSNATSGYVFDMIPGYEYANLSSTGIVPIFKDIILRVPDNQTCGGFNASRAQHAHFEGITSYPTSFTTPAGSLPFITMPALNSNGDTVLRDIYITRWTTAISLSEHCVLDNVLIAYCDTAFLVSGRGGGHRNYFSYVDVEQVNKVIRIASGSVSAAQFWGQLDVQSSSGWKMMLVSNETGSDGKILGRLDVGLIQAGSLGLSGQCTGLDVANGGRGQSAGWMTQHPYDTFGRIQGQSMNGVANGAPGYTWPSMHPWRLSTGDVNLASGSGSSGNMKMAAGQTIVKALLPVLDARTNGKPRSIEGTFTTPAAGNYSFAVVGARRYNADVCVYAQVRNGTVYLGVGTFTTGVGKVSKAGAVTNSSTVVLRLELAYAGSSVKVARVFIGGVLQLSYTLTAAESASVAASTTQPFVEDGVYFVDSDVSTACTNVVVRDLQPDPPYLGSGTVTLVAGTATVADTNITAGSIIRVFRQAAGGTMGDLSVALTAGTGFTINSSSTTDTSTVYYEVAAY